MRSKYRIMVGQENRLEFSADFGRADSQIQIDGSDTPFQVARAHSPRRAAELLIDWCRSDGEVVGPDEDWRLDQVR